MVAAARFVGRDDELAVLTGVFERAGEGSGAVVTVVGEPGQGKTALVDRATRAAGLPAVWARGREGGGAPPMWMWEQVVRSLAPDRGEDPLVADGGRVGDTGADRFRRFDAVARRLVDLHRGTPSLIVLDDLQWADEESLAFVDFLAPDANEHGIVVITTVRLGELDRLPRSDVVIELSGLAREAVGRLLTPPPGATQADTALVDAVWTHTGGNPLFITEVDRLLRAQGRVGDGTHWRGIVPEGVRSVIGRRLARLNQRTHRTLVAAAELGEEIDPAILAAALGRAGGAARDVRRDSLHDVPRAGVHEDPRDRFRDDLLDDLAAAADAGFVRPLPEGRFAFSHSLVRGAARSEFPAAQRRVLNRRAAHELAAIRGERAAAQIAQYLFAADDPEAAEWAVRAGEVAYAASMYAESAAWFERALERVGAASGGQAAAGASGRPSGHDVSGRRIGAEPSDRPGSAAVADRRGRADAPGDLALRLRYAEALSRCGRNADAEAEFLAVSRAARATGDAVLLARAALGVGSIGGGFEVRLLDPAQQALLAEAIERLDVEDDRVAGRAGDRADGTADRGGSALLAMLMARLSIAKSLAADDEERTRLAEDALAMARRVGDDAAIGAALGAWCDAHAGPRDIDVRAVAATEMLVVAQRSGDPELELLARRLAIVAALEAGDIGIVKRHATAFAALADRLRLPQFRWYARLVEGMLAHLAGELETAAALATEAAELGRLANSANARMLAEGALGPAVARDRGDPRYLERFLEVNAGTPEASRGADIATAFTLYSVGYGGTADQVASGIAPFEELWRGTSIHDGLCLYTGWMLANAVALVGDARLIAETEAVLEPFADRFALDGTGSVCYEPISASLARLAAARGETGLARQRFRQAIAAARRIGAPLVRDRLERELAELGRSAPITATAHPETGHAGPMCHGMARHEIARDDNGRLALRRGTLRREGDVWLVAFAGDSTRLKHVKGLTDLATLLARPNQDVHVFDLVAVAEGRSAGSDREPDRSDAGPTIDATARTAYERRIRDLSEQIETAETSGDDARAASLDEERAALITHLARALGLGGKSRIAGSDVERARKAVGMRLRDTVKRIGAELPELGRHLRSAVQTGTSCSYRPETPTVWTVSTRSASSGSGPTDTAAARGAGRS